MTITNEPEVQYKDGRVVTLAGRVETAIPANAIEYLNRLGDLLFVLARVANRKAGLADDPWHPSP